ncbi:flavin-nucleotide-binding protein [Ramlibacter sp. G-1-2-2]|uniref:Flavin-nucleotide-binding protein n=1 Tax=Ramlibacter agri TaxID=2728837 RepID=A0A848H600_9BURK|nr:pyridoxamine 5'-phosphate oxidase family protein [Ramlibacter agri]NML43128.1 flavin-nucleotide-binding protein [Ramlibacter agri]
MNWHPGEIAMQQAAGVAARMEPVAARVLRDHMPDQHREFFALLPFVIAGTLDANGQPRVSLLAGEPGFAHSPDPRRLRLDAPTGTRGFADEDLAEDSPVGLLGLQAHTGRRNRMNGRIETSDAEGFTVHVDQSFGNCPKYIHQREAVHAPAATAAHSILMTEFDGAARALVESADTFFIATAHPAAAHGQDASEGVDVSHRGGPAGFVQVQDGSLLVPDYTGNSFFNTLGNLQLEPRCALLFVDFETGEQVHVQARGEVLQAGAQRMLRLIPAQVKNTAGGLPLRWL